MIEEDQITTPVTTEATGTETIEIEEAAADFGDRIETGTIGNRFTIFDITKVNFLINLRKGTPY